MRVCPDRRAGRAEGFPGLRAGESAIVKDPPAAAGGMRIGTNGSLPGWAPTPARVRGLVWSSRIALSAGGMPDIVLYFNGGLGDEIMRTAVARELRKRGRGKIWQFAAAPELYAGNPDLIAVPDDYRLYRLCRMFGIPCVQVNYPERPPRHFIAMMCSAAGIRGEVELRPRIVLAQKERRAGKRVRGRQIAVQTSSMAARYPMRNKLWPHKRFQRVAEALKETFDLVQVGAPSDPALAGALDLRGKTTIRETAAILASSHVFLGLASGLVHLARAVECRSVIVYGGREDPTLSGYSANENIHWSGVCAPCWLRNDCAFERRCMSEIRPEPVIEAVRRQAERWGTDLPVDRCEIPEG
jgi:Glycosyltransferase family 9 (heptosyltransferase)